MDLLNKLPKKQEDNFSQLVDKLTNLWNHKQDDLSDKTIKLIDHFFNLMAHGRLDVIVPANLLLSLSKIYALAERNQILVECNDFIFV